MQSRILVAAFVATGLTFASLGAQQQTQGLKPRAAAIQKQYTPLTQHERLGLYLKGTFGPSAVAKSAAAGGIRQWQGTPKEWGGGAGAYGERVGNSFAQHAIRGTLEYGASTLLHEDNRFFNSSETTLWKRTEYAVRSEFVARNDAGREHFAYSRFGAMLGAAFISRRWQPHSTNGAGDAFVSFGIGVATDVGWNEFREFFPDIREHFRRR